MVLMPIAKAAANDKTRFMILNPRCCVRIRGLADLATPILAIEASRAFVPPCTRKLRFRAAALGPDARSGSSRNPSHQLFSRESKRCATLKARNGVRPGVFRPTEVAGWCFFGHWSTTPASNINLLKRGNENAWFAAAFMAEIGMPGGIAPQLQNIDRICLF